MIVRKKSGSLSEAGRAKLILLGASVVLGVAHLLLIAGVPWSSLEWTKGFSLRYVLPSVMLYGLIAYVACFPESMRWWNRLGGRAGAIVMIAAVAVYVARQGSVGVPLDESAGRLTPSAALLAVVVLAAALAIRRLPRSRARAVALAALVLCLAASYAACGSRSDRVLMSSARSTLDRTTMCGAEPSSGISRYRSTYLALLAYERDAGITCSSRRLFTTARWDSPLDLQPAGYENQVFDVRGPTFRPWLLRRDWPGTRPCDYIIASQAEIDTSRGVALVNAMKTKGAERVVARYGPYVVLAPGGQSR